MYKLIVNNTTILPRSGNLSWSSDIDTLGTELSFESLFNLAEGSIVSFFINNKEYFRGIIVKKSESKFTYSYVAFDYSFYLKNEVIKQFNTTASGAITTLLNEYGIKNKVVNIPTKIQKIYKDESISSVIDDILSQAEQDQGIKYFKEMQSDTLIISKLQDMRIAPKILIGSDITINSSIEEMKNKILVVVNGEDNNSIIASSEDKANQSKFGVLQEIESIEEKDISQAKNIANNLLKSKNKIFKNTSINVLGIQGAETIRANRLIELNIKNKLKGWYRIKSASHSLTNGSHKVNISLEW